MINIFVCITFISVLMFIGLGELETARAHTHMGL